MNMRETLHISESERPDPGAESLVQKEKELIRESLDLSVWESKWPENYPDGENIPGNTKLAQDFINTIKPGSKLLEVGCGQGRVLTYLAKEKQVDGTGVDINKSAIKIAKKRCGEVAKFEWMNGAELLFPDDSFDLVVMAGVIGGVEKEEREKIMKEAFRVLREGGEAGIAEFKYNPDPEKAHKYDEAEKITHEKGTRVIRRGDKELFVKHFTEDELIDLFVRAGFAQTSIQTRGESFDPKPGIGDGIPEIRRQYTVWGTKPMAASV
jgi:SAM-dependent methyltransferase